MINNGGIRCEPATVCILCGTAGDPLYEGLTDHLFNAPGTWGIRRCRNVRCAVGWIDPKPMTEDVGKLYDTYYTHKTADDAPEVHTWPSHHGGSTEWIRKVLARLMPWRSEQFASGFYYLEDTPAGRLLEVGCGPGDFLAEATRRGWEAEGIDFDAKAIDVANSRDGVTARLGDIDHPSLKDGSYDAILLNHVIEHVLDPAHVFARCCALLKPGGRLVMITPNMEAQGHDIFAQDWRGLEIPRHITLFTARAFQRLGRKAGFSRVQVFSPIGGHETRFLIDQSRIIARRAGRTPPPADIAKMRRRAQIKTLLGRQRGEFVALVAER